MNEHVQPILAVRVAPRRALSREEAAGYVGIGTTLFDELVKSGDMPKPFRLKGRVLWDVRQLDGALDKAIAAAGPNPWDSVA